MYKGHDRVTIHITQNDGEMCIDEIKQYQDTRWVSAQVKKMIMIDKEVSTLFIPII